MLVTLSKSNSTSVPGTLNFKSLPPVKCLKWFDKWHDNTINKITSNFF